MTESIIQHIENKKQPYRVPVFAIKPSTIHFSDKVEKQASVIRLTTCDFVTNYYNISYTSNCLRWLRIPDYDNNDLIASQTNKTPENPYFRTNRTDLTTPILCKLYITPGSYENIVDIFSEINSKLYDSFVDLFKIHTNPTAVYKNQQFLYQYVSVKGEEEGDAPSSTKSYYIPSLFTKWGNIQLNNAVVQSVNLSSATSDMIYYYIPGSIRYEKDNIQYTLKNSIIGFSTPTLSNCSLINSVIHLPYFTTEDDESTELTTGNSFNVTFENQIYNIFDSTFASSIDTSMSETTAYKNATSNLLTSGILGDVDEIRCCIWSGGKQVLTDASNINIDSAMLSNFEEVSGIGKFSDRFNFQEDDNKTLGQFIYRYADGKYKLNEDLTITLSIPASTITEKNGTYYVDLSENANITIFNASGNNPIVLDGFIASTASSYKYPNCRILGDWIDDKEGKPMITFTTDDTSKIDIDDKAVHVDITMKGLYKGYTQVSSRNEDPTMTYYNGLRKVLNLVNEQQTRAQYETKQYIRDLTRKEYYSAKPGDDSHVYIKLFHYKVVYIPNSTTGKDELHEEVIDTPSIVEYNARYIKPDQVIEEILEELYTETELDSSTNLWTRNHIKNLTITYGTVDTKDCIPTGGVIRTCFNTDVKSVKVSDGESPWTKTTTQTNIINDELIDDAVYNSYLINPRYPQSNITYTWTPEKQIITSPKPENPGPGERLTTTTIKTINYWQSSSRIDADSNIAIFNPNYNPSATQKDINPQYITNLYYNPKVAIANPGYKPLEASTTSNPEFIANPIYDSTDTPYMLNPNYDPTQASTTFNPEYITNPAYDPSKPDYMTNPAYDSTKSSTTSNPQYIANENHDPLKLEYMENDDYNPTATQKNINAKYILNTPTVNLGHSYNPAKYDYMTNPNYDSTKSSDTSNPPFKDNPEYVAGVLQYVVNEEYIDTSKPTPYAPYNPLDDPQSNPYFTVVNPQIIINPDYDPDHDPDPSDPDYDPEIKPKYIISADRVNINSSYDPSEPTTHELLKINDKYKQAIPDPDYDPSKSIINPKWIWNTDNPIAIRNSSYDPSEPTINPQFIPNYYNSEVIRNLDYDPSKPTINPRYIPNTDNPKAIYNEPYDEDSETINPQYIPNYYNSEAIRNLDYDPSKPTTNPQYIANTNYNPNIAVANTSYDKDSDTVNPRYIANPNYNSNYTPPANPRSSNPPKYYGYARNEESTVNELTEKLVEMGYAVRVKKYKYPDEVRQTELNDIYGIDILPVSSSKDPTTNETIWKLDLEASSIGFNTITIKKAGAAHDATYHDLEGNIERYKYVQGVKQMVEYPIIDRKFSIHSGTCTAGIILTNPPTGTSLSDLFTLDDSNSIIKEVRSINENIRITYDTYYYKAYRLIMEKQSEANFISLITADENNKLAIKFFTSVIPITSPTIYTSTVDFLNVLQDPNFNLKTSTLHLEPIIEFDDITGKPKLTTNNFKLSKYTQQNNNVDNFYYNFAIDKNDLWSKLGFIPCNIQYDKTTIMSYNSKNKADESDSVEQVYPIYTVKGIYYSETLYTGPIYTPSVIKLESYEQNLSSANIRKIILPENYNIMKLLTSAYNTILFNTYFNKATHYAQRLMNLSIPKTIEVKMTQNKDIEEYLNSNEITDSIANIGQYQVVRDNQTTIASIQQQLTINNTIEIPDERTIYIFLTNGNQIYSLMDTVATLNVEYIN